MSAENSPKLPLVSVVTATYDMEHFLADAIESVRDQSYPNIQHIIIDDGSTDNTRALVDQYKHDPRIEYHPQENKGQTIAKCENCGIRGQRFKRRFTAAGGY